MINKSYYFLFLFVFITNCKSTQKGISNLPLDNLKNISIQKLIADEFSENLSRLSTQNDEILLLLSFYKKGNPQAIVHKTYGTFLFDRSNKEQLIEEIIDINEGYFIATLVEIDSERTSDAIAQDIFEMYETIDHSKIESDDNKTKLELAIGDDDFLDVEYVDLATLNQKNEITFWGIHLFDEFQYRLLINGISFK